MATGKILDGRYELLELLGEGGMGSVYKARHLRLGKIFAVKSLSTLSEDPREQAQFLAAFEDEARTLAELDHPALAQVSDFFELDETHYLVMEYIDGRTLTRVAEQAPKNFSQRRVSHWAKELLEVLRYLHERVPAVIVRDLKPDNVMLDGKRRLRLIDFGISKRMIPGSGTRDIVKGMGTAEYAPLEQYGASPTDQRSDLYALGGTLYFLLTDQAPPPAWKRASEGAELVSPRAVNPTVSASFEEFVFRLLELRREDRPGSAREALEMLQATEEDAGTRSYGHLATPGSTPPASVSTPAPAPMAAPPAPSAPVYAEFVDGLRADGAPPEQDLTGRYALAGELVQDQRFQARTSGEAPVVSKVSVLGCNSLRRYATVPHALCWIDGTVLAAVGGRFLHLWDCRTEQLAHKIWTGDQQVSALALGNRGRLLAASELEGEVHLYDLARGAHQKTLGRKTWGLFPDRVRSLAFLDRADRLAVASDASNIRIFDTGTGEVVSLVEWHEGGFFSRLSRKTVCLVSCPGGWLAGGGADGTVSLYRYGANSELELQGRWEAATTELSDIALSPNATLLACGTLRGKLAVYGLASRKLLYEVAAPTSLRCLRFSPDGALLVGGFSDGGVRLYRARDGTELLKLSHHRGAVLALAFSDRERLLLSGGNDRRLYLTRLAW